MPEPKTVKQRVHLDLHVAAVADLIALGATVLDDSQPWTDMADPEGGELCAFVRDPATLTDYRLYEVVVDSADPVMIAPGGPSGSAVPVEHERDQESSWLEPPGCPSGWCSAGCPSPRRSRTGCTGTYAGRSTS